MAYYDHGFPSEKRYLSRFDAILDRMTEAMTCARLTRSISHNFIVQILPHHRAAVEMSQNILDNTNEPALRNAAIQIISMQEQRNKALQGIQLPCALMRNPGEDVARYQAQVSRILEAMFRDMRRAPVTGDPAKDFIYEMLPHHRGAVEMSQNALAYPVCQSLYPVLDSLIVSKKQGIRQLEEILRQLGERPAR